MSCDVIVGPGRPRSQGRRSCYDGWTVPGSSGLEAVRLCREQEPDVLLMDVRMPGTSGVEATRRVVAELPAVGVLMLTMLEADRS
ncbi:MAG: response regulator transcription factor [Hamadaea sp.]|nr:response regulator transcription factor [Hamadaea sp.]